VAQSHRTGGSITPRLFNNIVGVPETASYIENGVTHYYTVTTRESFLMGKYGGAKVTTYWDGNRLLTIKIGSGKQTRYNH